jgi:beta-alanine degradation protein BauB
MRQKFFFVCSLTLSMVPAIISCGPQEKKEDASATTDTTQATAVSETPAQDVTPDAVTAAPNVYKVLKDTMGIRVLDVSANAGDSVAFHSHPDAVLYVISGGKAEFVQKDGASQVVELKSGTISVDPAHSHVVKNIGTTAIKAVLFEVSRSNNPGTAQDAALDPLKVAPALYKLEKDTMNIRVMTATYKAGASSKLHAHPDHLGYVIGGGAAEFTAKDGTKTVATVPAGAVLASPAGQHSVKNTGKSSFKVLLVEVNRGG